MVEPNKKPAYLVFAAIFVLSEIIFNYVALTKGDEEVFELFFKSFLFFIFIWLHLKDMKFTKWVLGISLGLYGLACFPAGGETNIAFYFIGSFNFIFAIFIFYSAGSTSSKIQEMTGAEDVIDIIAPPETIVDADYAGVSDRAKAMVTDGLIIVIFMIIATTVLSQFDNVPVAVRIIVFTFIFLLYDPLFTSTFGATLGHMIFGLRVKRENDHSKRNIPFHLAVIRYIVKALLGIISLFTVMGSDKRMAIHDYMVGSVVLHKHEEKQIA